MVYANRRLSEWIVEGTKAEAKTYEAQRRVELGAGAPSKRTAPTFSAFCETVYNPHAEQHLKESTWRKVRRYQVATLVEHLGHLKLTEIDANAVARFKLARSGAGMQASSVNNELRVLNTILVHAKTLGYPCVETKLQRLKARGRSRAAAWSTSEVQRLFAACATHVPEILPMIVFLANTGCRKGEAIAAEWSWVDAKAGLLRIPVSDVWQPKSNKPREVPLPKAAIEALGPRNASQWLFPNRGGGRYVEFPEELWRRARDRAGLKGGPHQLRHTFASHFLAKVPDLRLLGEILGHEKIETTMIYAHFLPGHLERAKNAVSMALPKKTLAATLARST